LVVVTVFTITRRLGQLHQRNLRTDGSGAPQVYDSDLYPHLIAYYVDRVVPWTENVPLGVTGVVGLENGVSSVGPGDYYKTEKKRTS
jgi:hypothetical protein